MTAVLDGRCPTCGGKHTTWSPQRIVEAIQRWADEHGQPPRVSDWNRASVDHPTYQSAVEKFGSWNAAIQAAGFKPRPAGSRPPVWDREAAVRALVRWRFVHGRLPLRDEWQPRDYSGLRPSADQVARLFGSWREFMRVAA